MLAATPAALEALAAAGPEDVQRRPPCDPEVEFHVTGIRAERDRRAGVRWDDFIRETNSRINNMRATPRERTEREGEREEKAQQAHGRRKKKRARKGKGEGNS